MVFSVKYIGESLGNFPLQYELRYYLADRPISAH